MTPIGLIETSAFQGNYFSEQEKRTAECILHLFEGMSIDRARALLNACAESLNYLEIQFEHKNFEQCVDEFLSS